MERHLLRSDAVIGGSVARPRDTVHSKVPGRQYDLFIRVRLKPGRVLEVRVVAKRSKVIATVVAVVLDNLRLLLGGMARFGASLLRLLLLCRE